MQAVAENRIVMQVIAGDHRHAPNELKERVFNDILDNLERRGLIDPQPPQNVWDFLWHNYHL